MRFSSNAYFFFFLAVFFAFFAFFAFLAMLPSVIPKLVHASRPSTCMHSTYTTIAKLILRVSKKVNDRRAIALAVGQKSRVMRYDLQTHIENQLRRRAGYSSSERSNAGIRVTARSEGSRRETLILAGATGSLDRAAVARARSIEASRGVSSLPETPMSKNRGYRFGPFARGFSGAVAQT
jgi:hypothetical protein